MILLFNKPYGVLSQFTDEEGRPTLADFIDEPHVYAAGRLDFDSEGLVLLTDDGRVQHDITGVSKRYWAQLDGEITDEALAALRIGVLLKDGPTKPAAAVRLPEPRVWPRTPPIRFRKTVPTSWVELTITEGRNRQVRRMTAAAGFPTLRLIRVAIGPYELGSLAPGSSRQATEQLLHETSDGHRSSER